MAYNYEYPYTDPNRSNGDWMLYKMKSLDQQMQMFSSTNTLKYANPIEWNGNTYYEQNTVVLAPDGNSYVSTQLVPSGIPYTNTQYWRKISDFNAQLGAIQSDISKIKNSVINVKDYGATGDGVTDDTAAIARAIAACPAYSTIYIPNGYFITSQLTINKPISIVGQGHIKPLVDGETIIVYDCDTTPFYLIKISGITFNGIGKNNVTAVAILGTNEAYNPFAHNTIENCAFHELERAILINKKPDSLKETYVNWNVFTGNVFVNCKYAIDFYSGSGTGNIINSSTFVTKDSGFCIRYGAYDGNHGNIGDIIISACQFGGKGTGIIFDGYNASYCERYVVTNCQFDAYIETGISVHKSHNFTITNNSWGGASPISINDCYDYHCDYPRSTEQYIDRYKGITANTLTKFCVVKFIETSTNIVGSVLAEVFVESTISGLGRRCAYIKFMYDTDTRTIDIISSKKYQGENGITITLNSEANNQIGIFVTNIGNGGAHVHVKTVGYNVQLIEQN